MLEQQLVEHNFSPEMLDKIDKKINLKFKLNSPQEIRHLILQGVNLIVIKDPASSELKQFYQQIVGSNNQQDNLSSEDIEYLVYKFLAAVENNNFWDYSLVIKLMNKLKYLNEEKIITEIKEKLKEYFSQLLAELESDFFVRDYQQDSQLGIIANLILNFWEQEVKDWHKEDLLLIKLQLIELDLKPQQKIKIKDFYKYLNNHPQLCTEFIAKISDNKYQEHNSQDIPLVVGLLELEKLINNDHYLCEAIVNKMNGLGIEYNQEKFNLEILTESLAKNANFDLEKELELFDFIVELITDLTIVSKVKEEKETGQKLIEAIKTENFGRAKELINSQIDVNIKDEQGKTPLIWAAEKENEELLLKLMKAGAKLDATDNQGRTVLSRIHSSYQMEVMQRLNENKD